MKSFDGNAPKKPTNLSINSDLLLKARELNINISATLEHALADQLTLMQREKWLSENANAIDAYNEYIENNVCFSDDIRGF
jgi:antitoxin CcdA